MTTWESTIDEVHQAKPSTVWRSRSSAWYRSLIRRGIPASAGLLRTMNLRNRHRGERAYFVGNGPSLKPEDLDLLKGRLTFGFNKIDLIYDRTQWRPTYHVIQDLFVLAHSKTKLSEFARTSRLLLTDRCHVSVPGAHRYHERIVKDENRLHFCSHPVFGPISFGTVIFSAFQLAWFMGVRDFVLLGVDCDYGVPKQDQVHRSSRERVYESKGEATHFDPSYYASGTVWSMANRSHQLATFEHMARLANGAALSVLNATRGGKLECFPRMNLEDTLHADQARPKLLPRPRKRKLDRAFIVGTDKISRLAGREIAWDYDVAGFVDDSAGMTSLDGLPVLSRRRIPAGAFVCVPQVRGIVSSIPCKGFPEATRFCIYEVDCGAKVRGEAIRRILAPYGGRSVFIFGASEGGRRALSLLSRYVAVAGFLDNDSSKQGQRFLGLPVEGPSRSLTTDEGLIVVASLYYCEIVKQLREGYGIQDERILGLDPDVL